MPHPDFQLFTLLSSGALAASGPWARVPYADTPRFDVDTLHS